MQLGTSGVRGSGNSSQKPSLLEAGQGGADSPAGWGTGQAPRGPPKYSGPSGTQTRVRGQKLLQQAAGSLLLLFLQPRVSPSARHD